jgi:uncharacterized protein
MSAYTIIDSDTHVTETPDLWTSRAPAGMRDRVPRIETSSKGALRWVLGGKQGMLASPGMTATAGAGSFKNPPRTYEQMHPGAYDARARLKYMDQIGIWAMVMYPNVGGFGAQQFLKLNDPELMLTCVRIYNDWQTERASADSRRLLPITSIPFWDVAAAATEVRRCDLPISFHVYGRLPSRLRRDGTQGDSVHRRAAILWPAAAGRSALESISRDSSRTTPSRIARAGR